MFIELLRYQNIADDFDKEGLSGAASALDSKIDRMSAFIRNLYKLNLSEYDKHRLLFSKNMLDIISSNNKKISPLDFEDTELDDAIESIFSKRNSEMIKMAAKKDEEAVSYNNSSLLEALDISSILNSNKEKLKNKENGYNRYWLPIKQYKSEEWERLLKEDPVAHDLWRISNGETPLAITTKGVLGVSQEEAKAIVDFCGGKHGGRNVRLFPGMTFSSFAALVKRSRGDEISDAEDHYISTMSVEDAIGEYNKRISPLFSNYFMDREVQNRIETQRTSEGGEASFDSALAALQRFPNSPRQQAKINKLCEIGDFSGLFSAIFMSARSTVMQGEGGKVFQPIPKTESILFSGGPIEARRLAYKIMGELGMMRSKGFSTDEMVDWINENWDFTSIERSPFSDRISQIPPNWFDFGIGEGTSESGRKKKDSVKKGSVEAAIMAEKEKQRKGEEYNPILVNLDRDKIYEAVRSMGMLDRVVMYSLASVDNGMRKIQDDEFNSKMRGISDLSQSAALRAVQERFGVDPFEEEITDKENHKQALLYFEKIRKTAFERQFNEIRDTTEAREYFNRKAEDLGFLKFAVRSPRSRSGNPGELAMVRDAVMESKKNRDDRAKAYLKMFDIMSEDSEAWEEGSLTLNIQKGIDAIRGEVDVGAEIMTVLPFYMNAIEIRSIESMQEAQGAEGSYHKEMEDERASIPGSRESIMPEGHSQRASSGTGETVVNPEYMDDLIKAVMRSCGDNNGIGKAIGISEYGFGNKSEDKVQEERMFTAVKNAFLSYRKESMAKEDYNEDDDDNTPEDALLEEKDEIKERDLITSTKYGDKKTVAIFNDWLKKMEVSEEAYEGSFSEEDLEESSYPSIYSISDLGKHGGLLEESPDEFMDAVRSGRRKKNPDFDKLISIKEAMKQIIVNPDFDKAFKESFYEHGSSGSGRGSLMLDGLEEFNGIKGFNANLSSYKSGRMTAYLMYVCSIPKSATSFMTMENKQNIDKKVSLYLKMLEWGVIKSGNEDIIDAWGDSVESISDYFPELRDLSFMEKMKRAGAISKSGDYLDLISNAPKDNDVDIAMYLASDYATEDSVRKSPKSMYVTFKKFNMTEERVRDFYLMRMRRVLDAFRQGILTKANDSRDMGYLDPKVTSRSAFYGEAIGRDGAEIDEYIANVRSAGAIKNVDDRKALIEGERKKFEDKCSEILILFKKNNDQIEYANEQLSLAYSRRGYKALPSLTFENATDLFNQYREYVANRYNSEVIDEFSEDTPEGPKTLEKLMTEEFNKNLDIKLKPNGEEVVEEQKPTLPMFPAIHEKISEFCREYTTQYRKMGDKETSCPDTLKQYYDSTADEERLNAIEEEPSYDYVHVLGEDPMSRIDEYINMANFNGLENAFTKAWTEENIRQKTKNPDYEIAKDDKKALEVVVNVIEALRDGFEDSCTEVVTDDKRLYDSESLILKVESFLSKYRKMYEDPNISKFYNERKEEDLIALLEYLRGDEADVSDQEQEVVEVPKVVPDVRQQQQAPPPAQRDVQPIVIEPPMFDSAKQNTQEGFELVKSLLRMSGGFGGSENKFKIIPQSDFFKILTQLGFDLGPSIGYGKNFFEIRGYPSWYYDFLRRGTSAGRDDSILMKLSMSDDEVEMILERYGF